MSQKPENLHFSTCLTLLRSYLIYLVNRQERSLLKSSFSVFCKKGNFIYSSHLPFAINIMLKLSSIFNLMTRVDLIGFLLPCFAILVCSLVT